jgi:hypothetical protein
VGDGQPVVAVNEDDLFYTPLLVHPLEAGAIVGIVIEIRDGQALLTEAIEFSADTEVENLFGQAVTVPVEPRATPVQEAFWSGSWLGQQLRQISASRKVHEFALRQLDKREEKLRQMSNHWAELDARDRDAR